MPLAIRSSATLPLTRVGQDRLGGGDGGFGGGGTHVGDRLRLGLGDLGFGHLGAARDEFLHLGLGLGGDALGLGPGAGDDRLRLVLGLRCLRWYCASRACASSLSRRASSSSALMRSPAPSSAFIMILCTPK